MEILIAIGIGIFFIMLWTGADRYADRRDLEKKYYEQYLKDHKD